MIRGNPIQSNATQPSSKDYVSSLAPSFSPRSAHASPRNKRQLGGGPQLTACSRGGTERSCVGQYRSRLHWLANLVIGPTAAQRPCATGSNSILLLQMILYHQHWLNSQALLHFCTKTCEDNQAEESRGRWSLILSHWILSSSSWIWSSSFSWINAKLKPNFFFSLLCSPYYISGV
jgi:hypothetical protein